MNPSHHAPLHEVRPTPGRCLPGPHTPQATQWLEPTTHSPGDYIQNLSLSDSTPPQLTVAFEVCRRKDPWFAYHLTPPSLVDESRFRDRKSIHILLESQRSITPDTLCVSVAFEHSTGLFTSSSKVICDHEHRDLLSCVITRIVRVNLMNGAHPRITIHHLPTELLMKIFDDTGSCGWQPELLSFAQVCRHWSQCCMKLLFARLESSECNRRCPSFPTRSFDLRAFAKALRKTPGFGLDVHHLALSQQSRCTCRNPALQKKPPEIEVDPAFIPILHATKNLQRLHLSLECPSRANALLLAFPKLRRLDTLSIAGTTDQCSLTMGKHLAYKISAPQFARSMTCLPALTSLTVGRLLPGNATEVVQFFMQRPSCALTQLCIYDSSLSDEDLLHLTASSANTLTQVELKCVVGITPDGLQSFLNSISGNVTSLTIRCFPESSSSSKENLLVLDAVVDKMQCLQELNIHGDVASEVMLRRRSEMFVRSCGSGVPVVRLSFQCVPGITGCRSHEWVGWEIVNVC